MARGVGVRLPNSGVAGHHKWQSGSGPRQHGKVRTTPCKVPNTKAGACALRRELHGEHHDRCSRHPRSPGLAVAGLSLKPFCSRLARRASRELMASAMVRECVCGGGGLGKPQGGDGLRRLDRAKNVVDRLRDWGFICTGEERRLVRHRHPTHPQTPLREVSKGL